MSAPRSAALLIFRDHIDDEDVQTALEKIRDVLDPHFHPPEEPVRLMEWDNYVGPPIAYVP